MSTLRARLWQIVLVVSFLGFCYSAFADTGGGSAGGVTMPSVLPSGVAGLVLVVLLLGAWSLRKFSSVPFFHTTKGALLAAFLNAVVPTIIQAVEAHGLDLRAIQTAVVGAVFTLTMMNNPSNTATEQQAKVLGMRRDLSPPPGPPITKVGAMLPLLFIALSFAGCKTPAGQAAGAATTACELGQLPQNEQAVLASAAAIAAAGFANWQQDLKQLGASLAPGQFSCLLQALVAAWSAPKGELTTDRKAALERLQIYLNAHPAPAACARPPLRACTTDVLPRG